MIDKFQKRYLDHQNRKNKMFEEFEEVASEEKEKDIQLTYLVDNFSDMIETRVSQRIFNEMKVSYKELKFIKKAIINTPSSCNRQAIQAKITKKTDVLEKLLVGGSRWLGGADIAILLLADMEAYKSPAEVDFMPYLDAGFIGMSIYYACESLGLGCCFVNPNIREEDKEEFKNKFGGKYKFCGAVVIGNYNKKANKIKKSNKIFI